MDLFQSHQADFIELTKTVLKNIDRHIPDNELETFYEDLKSVIDFHDKKYYVEANSLISDYDYDVLFKKLKEIEAANPQLITADSPTQRVAKGLNEAFPTVRHLAPMMSLENSYNLQDLKEFDRRVHEAAPNNAVIEYICEPKFDGSSIALVYVNDVLVRAATRQWH
jgi:DNA ligase (NAD+)